MNKGLGKVKEPDVDIWGKSVQAEETARAKALKQRCACRFRNHDGGQFGLEQSGPEEE